jgi:hypothetical protein
MATRACARCGASIEPPNHLCARCLDELPFERPTRVATIDHPTGTDEIEPDTDELPEGLERAEDAPEGPTWRGRPVAPGMILPSRIQYHGTMYGLIAVGVVVTMVAAVLINKGVGPFTVTGANAHLTTSGTATVVVTAQVQNQGVHAGRARCVATWTDQNGSPHQSAVVDTQVIAPEATTSVTVPIPALARPPSPVGVDCR